MKLVYWIEREPPKVRFYWRPIARSNDHYGRREPQLEPVLATTSPTTATTTDANGTNGTSDTTSNDPRVSNFDHHYSYRNDERDTKKRTIEVGSGRGNVSSIAGISYDATY